MSRNPLIEAIHEARYDLETCSPEEQAACRRQLEGLVEQALTQTGAKTSISTVLNALYDDYKEFRRMKRRQEWPRL
jgi:hypothetical protein